MWQDMKYLIIYPAGNTLHVGKLQAQGPAFLKPGGKLWRTFQTFLSENTQKHCNIAK